MNLNSIFEGVFTGNVEYKILGIFRNKGVNLLKRGIGLGLIVALIFSSFVLLKDTLGMSSFFMAAIAMAMYAVLGQVGDYFKAGLSMLVGVIVGLAGILVLATKMPLPPNNTVYLALICGLSLFVLVIISTIGLRVDAMFLGWAGYFASVWSIYTTNVSALATEALSAAVGVSVALLLGLIMAIIVTKIDRVIVNH